MTDHGFWYHKWLADTNTDSDILNLGLKKKNYVYHIAFENIMSFRGFCLWVLLLASLNKSLKYGFVCPHEFQEIMILPQY